MATCLLTWVMIAIKNINVMFIAEITVIKESVRERGRERLIQLYISDVTTVSSLEI